MEKAARWTSLFALAATLCASAGGAFASIDRTQGVRFDPSEAPALLAPIDSRGRTGWNCEAERAARARASTAAVLPST